MNITSPDQVFLRDYSRIYTGTNQENGYEHPFLGFTTDTVEVIFKKDKSTYFHYPKTANQIALSATDLVNSGAIAGNIPYFADRIYKMNANYENDKEWGFAYPENHQKGNWLCSWLSGGNSADTPVWIDRWFKPGFLNSTQTSFTCSNSAIYDELSQMTLDPGVWYRYDHIGDIANQSMVDMICGLVLYIDGWDKIALDTSGYQNSAIINNFTEDNIGVGVNHNERPDDVSFVIQKPNQYAYVLYNSSFNILPDLSVNAWVKSDNWQQHSHHFISNGFRGGWSIGVNNGFNTPFIAVADERGHIVFGNQKGNLYKDISLPGTPAAVALSVDQEMYTWVLDNGVYNGDKHLYKIDYNGNISNTVSFLSGVQLYDIGIDKNNLVWVTNNQTNASAFNTFCEFVSSSPVNNKKLLISNQNILTAYDASDASIFKNEYYWTIQSGNLYYNTVSTNNILVYDGGDMCNVECSIDNIWALTEDNKIFKYDMRVSLLSSATPEVSFVFNTSSHIGDTILNSISGKNLFITNEYVEGNRDYIWALIPNTKYLYKFDTDLNLTKKINLSYIENTINSNALKGDSTCYQWHQKYNYSNLAVSAMPQIEASVYLGTTNYLISGTKYTTILSTSALTENDWHMFTFNIDTVGGKVELFVDAVLRDTISIPLSTQIYYKYETPLTIGTNIGHINTIDEELNNQGRLYHKGGFDGLSLYSQSLNTSDIQHIYLSKYDFRDLVWNMPTGVQSYVEEIVKFFKFKMPGQKSQYYNIYLRGLGITDKSTREIIENIIKDTISKIAPLYTSLYKIIWD
jgi:hypothetical protein